MSWQDKALAAFWADAFANETLDSHRRIEAAIAAAAASLLPFKDAPMTDHPITPPPELVQQWVSLACEYEGNETWIDLATQAARWGANQELEACCEWLDRQKLAKHESLIPYLRAARRPKFPSLAEEAHDALGRFFSNAHTHASQMTQDFEILRHAVERLQELEGAND